MEIHVNSKFEIGETVRVKDSTTHLVINNVIAEACSGGIQIIYRGVVTFQALNLGERKTFRTVEPRYTVNGFNESVLERIPSEV